MREQSARSSALGCADWRAGAAPPIHCDCARGSIHTAKCNEEERIKQKLLCARLLAFPRSDSGRLLCPLQQPRSTLPLPVPGVGWILPRVLGRHHILHPGHVTARLAAPTSRPALPRGRLVSHASIVAQKVCPVFSGGSGEPKGRTTLCDVGLVFPRASLHEYAQNAR